MKLITSEMDAETEKWQETSTQMEDNNDIVKRAKNMSAMAFSMYQFTKGEGALKTTQDLFTQAEYFAEEANRLYKVIRQFSYQVPNHKTIVIFSNIFQNFVLNNQCKQIDFYIFQCLLYFYKDKHLHLMSHV